MALLTGWLQQQGYRVVSGPPSRGKGGWGVAEDVDSTLGNVNN